MRARRTAATAAGALAAALLGLVTGCGGEADQTAEVERQVRAALADRFADLDDPGGVDVDCPDDLELEAGTSLTCELVVGDAAPQAAGFDVNEDGVLVLATAVAPTSAVEALLAERLAGPAESSVEVDCGAAPLVVGEVGDTITCQAVRGDGAPFTVGAEITGLDTSIQLVYDVTPATTTTTAPAG